MSINRSRNAKKQQTAGVKKVGELDLNRKEIKSALPDEIITTDEDYIDNDTTIHPESDDSLLELDANGNAVNVDVKAEVDQHMALLQLAKETIQKQEELLDLLRVDSATLVDGIQRIANHNASKPDLVITGILEVIAEYFDSEDYKKQVALIKEM